VPVCRVLGLTCLRACSTALKLIRFATLCWPARALVNTTATPLPPVCSLLTPPALLLVYVPAAIPPRPHHPQTSPQGVDDDPDEEVAEPGDPQPHLPGRLKGKAIWHTPAEREAWRAAVGAAATAASLAFCAAALAFHAQGPLQALADKGKGGKQKQLPPPAQQQQAGSSRGGSRQRR
jgi:hypothetical protein